MSRYTKGITIPKAFALNSPYSQKKGTIIIPEKKKKGGSQLPSQPNEVTPEFMNTSSDFNKNGQQKIQINRFHFESRQFEICDLQFPFHQDYLSQCDPDEFQLQSRNSEIEKISFDVPSEFDFVEF